MTGRATPEEWMAQSRCLTIPVWEADLMFFPPDPNNNGPAKRFCNGTRGPTDTPCPVQEDCLNYALRVDEQFGVWGGKSTRERQAITRKTREAA